MFSELDILSEMVDFGVDACVYFSLLFACCWFGLVEEVRLDSCDL